MTPHRFSLRPALAGALALGVLAALALATPSAAAKSAGNRFSSYVALGDSFTAAPWVPHQVHEACARSDKNYPSLVAKELKPATFTDVSCSDATTLALTEPQRQGDSVIAPPQFDALKRDTRLVTMGMGGNDAGYGSIRNTCVLLSLTNPWGSPCRDRYTSGDSDELADSVKAAAVKIGQALDGIHARSPRATVLVVGYPTILPDTGDGCFPMVPVAKGDVPYLRNFIKSLNAALEQQAKSHNARFVDTYKPTIGHDVCQPTGTRWVEGIIPTSPAAPVHPNALGEQAMAKAALAVLGRR